jgi:hypothetical protein
MYGHLEKKNMQAKYRRKTTKNNQSTATLDPMEKSLIHTRNKKITW